MSKTSALKKALYFGQALVVVSCVGRGVPVEGERGKEDASTPPSDFKPPPAIQANCGTVDPGFVGLRRLNRLEIDYALRDLLGEKDRVATALPNEDTILAEQGNISALAFEKFEAIADGSVEAAWARDVAKKDPASARLLICTLKPDDKECVRKIIKAFARKAWRRPLQDDETMRLVTIVDGALANKEDLAIGVRSAIKAVLLSPEFLFKTEGLDNKTGVNALSSHELASRLSFWLWGTVPDSKLSAVADANALTDKATRDAEIGRMLADPRADAFMESFADFWLGLTALSVVKPSSSKFPQFDEDLRAAAGNETKQFIRTFALENRPIRDLLDADFTILNQRLAKHYGVPFDGGPGEWKRTNLPAGPRRGLLAHAGVLMMTSASTRTSPVKRGKWVLTNLLCSKPPAPPPDVVVSDSEAINAKTERQRLEQHRSKPQCASCHSLIDPIGLGIENFDVLGGYRTAYDNGNGIDPSGTLTDGSRFSSFEDLRSLLKQDERVPGCLTSTLFTYAVGRLVTDADKCAMDSIAAALSKSGGMRDFIFALADTKAFLARRDETGVVKQ